MNRKSKEAKITFDDEEKSEMHPHDDKQQQRGQKKSKKLSNKMSHSKINNNERKIIFHMHNNNSNWRRHSQSQRRRRQSDIYFRNNDESNHQMAAGSGQGNQGRNPPSNRGRGRQPNAGRRRRRLSSNFAHARGPRPNAIRGRRHARGRRIQNGDGRRGKMSLYCANCVRSYRLKWPFLGTINWNQFSYQRELRKYVEHNLSQLRAVREEEEMIRDMSALNIAEQKEQEPQVRPRNMDLNSRLFGRMNGEDMALNNAQTGCTHRVGYGQIYCQYCGEDITVRFNPKIWQCPRCEKEVHGAISTAKCIKIH
eukprot:7673_1